MNGTKIGVASATAIFMASSAHGADMTKLH